MEENSFKINKHPYTEIVKEYTGELSIFYHFEDVFDEKYVTEIKDYLDKIEDWRCGYRLDKSIARKQKWFHWNGKPFDKEWVEKNDRWKSFEYDDFLLKLEEKINDKIRKYIDCKINSLLLNFYPDGKNSISPHKDSFESFGETPTIIIYSIGETREFILERTYRNRMKRNKSEKHLNRKIQLKNNSIFIMSGASQLFYCHSVKKDSEITKSRHSFTFREHLY